MRDEIIALFPDRFRIELSSIFEKNRNNIEEIRVRINRPLEIVMHTNFLILEKLIPNEADGQFIFNQLSGFSRYKFEEELKTGYITLVGRSEEHTSELQSRGHLVCRLLLEKKT